MPSLADSREAKQYLERRITEQAKRDGVPLSETERKMLYFSEMYWTLPGMMEVSAEFDREYDQDEYERKIAAIVGNIYRELAQDEAADRDWENAITILSKEDHYILVLIGLADAKNPNAPRPPGGFARLVLTALVVVAILLAVAWFVHEGR